MKLIIILFEIFVLAFVIGYFFFIIALADGASTENKNTEQHENN